MFQEIIQRFHREFSWICFGISFRDFPVFRQGLLRVIPGISTRDSLKISDGALHENSARVPSVTPTRGYRRIPSGTPTKFSQSSSRDFYQWFSEKTFLHFLYYCNFCRRIFKFYFKVFYQISSVVLPEMTEGFRNSFRNFPLT